MIVMKFWKNSKNLSLLMNLNISNNDNIAEWINLFKLNYINNLKMKLLVLLALFISVINA